MDHNYYVCTDYWKTYSECTRVFSGQSKNSKTEPAFFVSVHFRFNEDYLNKNIVPPPKKVEEI